MNAELMAYLLDPSCPQAEPTAEEAAVALFKSLGTLKKAQFYRWLAKSGRLNEGMEK